MRKRFRQNDEMKTIEWEIREKFILRWYYGQ